MSSSVQQAPKKGLLLQGLSLLRDSHRLTQEELGKKVDIAAETLSDHENGLPFSLEVPGNWKKFLHLCQVLECKPLQLLCSDPVLCSDLLKRNSSQGQWAKTNQTKHARNAQVVVQHQQGKTMAAIAREMGVTRERIRQILVRARRYQAAERSAS